MTKEELLSSPEYMLTKYQNEIYRQLWEYMETNNLTQTEVAKRLNVSSSYVSQIINGNFNFTLKKLIELSLLIGKVPDIEFIGFNEYWLRERVGRGTSYFYTATATGTLMLPIQGDQIETISSMALCTTTSINANAEQSVTIYPIK